MADVDDLHRQIDELVAEEHQLRGDGSGLDDAGRARLVELETRLDQLWDLLRQRDARRDACADPDAAQVRPASEVEGYLQ